MTSATTADLADIDTLAWIDACPPPASQAPPADRPEPPIGPDWAGQPFLAHFAGLARRLPEQPALDDGRLRLTFAQLYEAACRLGAALRAAGLPEGAIGVLLPDDARYILAMLGCLAAGRPCMLLTAATPAPFLRHTVQAARLAGVVTTAELAARLPAGLAWLPADPALHGQGCPEPSLLAADAPALIVATSGSTGAPKAVVRSQRAMLANYVSRIRSLRTGPDDTAVMIAAPATAGAVTHRFSSLLAGATLHVLDLRSTGLVEALSRIGSAGATLLHATPLVLKALASLPAAPAAFARVRAVLTGGDSFLQADLRLLRSRLPPGCRVYFGLSLSEASRIAHWCVPPDDAHDPVRVASGYLSAGIQVLLLDEAGRPAAPGAPGELVVRTARAAIGEWIDGRLVTDRFPPDPRDPGRRIVRTGDIARICEDGVLVTLGRVDRMVKIGGLRVEPAAIELAMRAVPGVADAAVVAIQAAGTTRLVGFAVPAEAGPAPAGGADPLLDSIRAALRAGLPAAMLPASLRRIAAVPLTDGGKRDDRALQALAGRPG